MDAEKSGQFESWFAALMAGGEPDWDFREPGAGEAFLSACESHGVAPMVAHRLKGSRLWQVWPEAVRRTLAAREAGTGLILDLAGRDLAAVLSEAARRGVRPLIVKGAALAHTHYSSPHLRPRVDTDLFVDESQRASLEETVSRLGYRKTDAHPGKLILFQSNFVKTDPNGFSHAFDLHWRISNAHVFSKTFEFRELADRALPAPTLGEHARVCHPVDALLLACLHRVGHHANSRRLIWLYDIHLLAESLTPRQREALIELASEKALRAVCRDGLQAAASVFRGEVSTELAKRLADGDSTAEPSAALLDASRRRAALLLSDWRSVPGIAAKLRWAAENLFPPPPYMLRRYRVRSRLWLPLLYLRRLAGGLWRMLRRRP